ncbi:uncharacterized protein LOC121726411 [Aricia agestis]|uniref:uncharacterized protein LOC121726411 n=1 Tax=Aricia agestis TaxID=91739 RepID=UPI001C201621|nr:uncharacterized protein LOC121726411 [Aricia agestis]
MNYSPHSIALMLVVVAILGHNASFLSKDLAHSMSTMYVRDKTIDKLTWQCLRIRGDVPCVIHCVLSLFGIMNNRGDINVNNYNKRVNAFHHNDRRIVISDVGQKCADNLKGSTIGVCQKALKFVECTKILAVKM